jgi:hypothetical protein
MGIRSHSCHRTLTRDRRDFEQRMVDKAGQFGLSEKLEGESVEHPKLQAAPQPQKEKKKPKPFILLS